MGGESRATIGWSSSGRRPSVGDVPADSLRGSERRIEVDFFPLSFPRTAREPMVVKPEAGFPSSQLDKPTGGKIIIINCRGG